MDTVAIQDLNRDRDRDRDSAEFLGMARRLRDQVAAAAVVSSPMMKAIYNHAFATLDRRKRRRRPHIVWRPDYLLEVEQKWRAIPMTECLHLHVARTKISLVIHDVRVGSTVIANSAWPADDKELDLIVVGNRLTLDTTGARSDSAFMATLSLHGLSRRYRRGFANTDLAVMRDLGVLAQCKLPDAPTPNFYVQAPSGGEWRGAVTRFNGLDAAQALVFGVRTFV